MQDYGRWDAVAMAEHVRRGDVAPGDLLDEARQRVAAVNPALNAVIASMDNYAECVLAGVDRQAPFAGVPFLVKDLFLPMAGEPMSNGSRAMRHYVPEHDCPLAQRFREIGLVTFGKTNTAEFGNASLTAPVAFGPTNNPWNTDLNAGGSSGGSAAAVAAGIVPMAWGSDGGGSIRLPASYCGVFGFKPSRGINAYADAKAAWGDAVVSHVLTRSVRDSAAYLDLIVDNPMRVRRSQLQSFEGGYLHAVERGLHRELRVGLLIQSPVGRPVAPQAAAAAVQTSAICESLGHEVEELEWPFNGRALMRAFLRVVLHSTAQDLDAMAQLLGVPAAGLDIELANRFMATAGRGVTQEQVDAALREWREAAQAMSRLHEQFDVLLTPTVATPPLKHGALDPKPLERMLMRFMSSTRLARWSVNDALLDSMIDSSIYQTPFTPIANMTGQPAMSVPLFWDDARLPHGVQFIAAHGKDALLFALAAQLENACPWIDKRPPVSADALREVSASEVA